MNVDVGNIVKNAVGEEKTKGRNVRVLSENMKGFDYRDSNFLSRDFRRSPPKLYITAENNDFDPKVIQEWKDEGFNVEYFSVESCGDRYLQKLKGLSREKRSPCEKFGIVAYDKAAALCLEHYHILDNNPEYRLGLLIAYYPTSIPDPKGKFPNSISALVHLASKEEIGVTKQSQMIGIQGKRRTDRKKIDAGLGIGGKMQLAYPCYTYNAEAGFAEHDMEEYDGVSAELAFTRSLLAARKCFGLDPDNELVVDTVLQNKYFTRNAEQAVAAYTTHTVPAVTNTPTLSGGIGASELKKFYSKTFVNPPSTKTTLISRTIGVDRVVDELHFQFKHTKEIPWMLPGVPPTDKKVEILVVSIVSLKAGKLHHEHVYWDQASVLVQIGLLDPKIVGKAGEELGVKKLPIVGRKAARHVMSEFEDDEEEDEE